MDLFLTRFSAFASTEAEAACEGRTSFSHLPIFPCSSSLGAVLTCDCCRPAPDRESALHVRLCCLLSVRNLWLSEHELN